MKRKIFLKSNDGFYKEIFGKAKPLLPERMLVAWKLLGYLKEKKNEYRREYKAAKDLIKRKRDKIYRYDFVLHSEYFILNLLVDFLGNQGLDVRKRKPGMKKAMSLVDSRDVSLDRLYFLIRSRFATFVAPRRTQKTYTHNKFFKSPDSLEEVRANFHSKFSFVREI